MCLLDVSVFGVLLREFFTPEEVEEMIVDNKEIVEKRGQPFAVDIEILSEIIGQVNSYDNIQDKRERIIKKVAHLLGGIAYHQPFNEGNKEVAISWTLRFLSRNGFDLPVMSSNDKRDIYDLLIKTGLKFELDPTIISEVEEYLIARVKKL